MKNNNQFVTIVATSVIVLIIGYFLFSTSPQGKNTNQGNNSDDSANTAQGGLNSLIGKPLPEIKLSDKNGKIYTSEDFQGRNTVLFFNEGLMCYPACWNQMALFGKDPRFNSENIQAISVVVDSARDWERAIAKMPSLAQATTMFDINAEASSQLGLLTTASSMHKGSLPGHTYILVDKNKIVRYVLDDPNMAIANDKLIKKISELEK